MHSWRSEMCIQLRMPVSNFHLLASSVFCNLLHIQYPTKEIISKLNRFSKICSNATYFKNGPWDSFLEHFSLFLSCHSTHQEFCIFPSELQLLSCISSYARLKFPQGAKSMFYSGLFLCGAQHLGLVSLNTENRKCHFSFPDFIHPCPFLGYIFASYFLIFKIICLSSNG